VRKKTRRDPRVGESRDIGEEEENESRSNGEGKSRQRRGRKRGEIRGWGKVETGVRKKKTRRDPRVRESRDSGEEEENEERSSGGGKSRQG